MFESFQVNLGMTPEQSTDAVAYYRALSKADGYTTGARLFDGIGELIADLDRAGIPQATASSKPENQVVALMEHFALSPHLRAITGATPDERTLSAKADIVAEALRRLRAVDDGGEPRGGEGGGSSADGLDFFGDGGCARWASTRRGPCSSGIVTTMSRGAPSMTCR